MSAKIKIVVEGLNNELRANVLAYLTLAQEKENPSLSENRIRNYFNRSNEEIRQALRPFGFYKPTFKNDLENVNGEWRARYRINVGQQILVKNITITIKGQGRNFKSLTEAIKKFPLQTGDYLLHRLYEQGKSKLISAALAEGFANAKYVENKLLVDISKNSANIVLQLQTGKQHFFGNTRFQNTQINDSLLSRYLDYQQGDPFRSDKLQQLQADLEGSGYFANVDVLPQRDIIKDYQIPINVGLRLNKPNKFDLGLGYGTDTGIRGKFGWQRRVLGNRGHKISADITLSEIKKEYQLSYWIPLADPRTERAEVAAGLRNQSTVTSESIEQTLGFSLQSEQKEWRRSLFIEFENTDFTVGIQSDTTFLFTPGIFLSKGQSNNLIFPNRGFKLTLELKAASESLLSDINVARAVATGKYIYQPIKNGRLLFRGKLGTVVTGDFDRLPPSYRFFAGGDNSIRGYTYESLGPKDSTNNVIGGHQIAELSLEYDHNLSENWLAAIFYDAGSAFNDVKDPLSIGIGTGIRYKLPIGMLRVDYALAYSEENRPWKIHVTVGPDL
ncbi:MAG: autotransporter assembly complex family protein [Thiohalomonadales bacterium]